MPSSILIVEDQDADFETVERGLRRLGETRPIVRRYRADDALDFLYGRGEANPDEARPAIVLLDLHLEDGDGQELLERMKSDDYLKAIPVIVLSGTVDPRDVEECYRLGANSFVRKSIVLEEINHTLQTLKAFWLEAAVLPSRGNVAR